MKKKYLLVGLLLVLFTFPTPVILSMAENSRSLVNILYHQKAEDGVLLKQSKTLAGDFKLSDTAKKQIGVYSPGYPKKIAYLTFDDGPNPSVTPKVLNTLKKYNVKATFFMLGSCAEEYPNMVKCVYNDGHIIGNHSYSHRRKIFKSMAIFKKEVLGTNRVIKKAIGVNPTLFRPPYGKKLPSVYKMFLKSQGFSTYIWNVDSMDSSARNVPKQKIFNSVASSLKGKRDLVILLHDGGGHKQTAEALPGIIELLRKRGYAIEPFTPEARVSTKVEIK